MEGALEVAILIAVALPFLRLVACRPFLRRLGTAPEEAVLGIAALIAYGGGLAAVTAGAPDLLRPLAAGAIFVGGAALWRSRPDYGRGRGMPPGTLRIAPLGPWTDRDFFARDAARFGPVFKTSTLLSPTICVVGLPAAAELFTQHDQVLAPPARRIDRYIPRGFIRSMNEADHETYAPLLRSAVSGAVTRQAEGDLRATIDSALEAGGREPSVKATRIARQAVQRCFYRLFFGIESADSRIARLDRLFATLDGMQAWRRRRSEVNRAVDEIISLVTAPPIPEDSFLAAVQRKFPEAAGDPTLIRNLVFLLQTSGSDVSSLITWVLWMLGTHKTAVMSAEQAGVGDQTARAVVLETLRLSQSEYIVRRATRDISWRGVTIPRGTRVRVCVAESHRDPAVFEHPDEFEPARWFDGHPAHDSYSPFGSTHSRSRCLGEGLTLTIGKLFVEELLGNYDIEVTQDGPHEFSGVHWRPSSRFAIRLNPKSLSAV